MDASLREQMEASLRNQMDASQLNHQMMDSSDASHYDGGGRRSMNTAALNQTASHDQEAVRDALLEQIVNPYIEDDSPAAEALRANAQVHIGKMSKVARSINAQALRKIVKRASMRGHFGNVKGKPPRALPNQFQPSTDASPTPEASAMSIVQEEDGGSDVDLAAYDLGESDSDDNKGAAYDSDQGRMSASETSQIMSIKEGVAAAAQRPAANKYKTNNGSPVKGSGNVVTKTSPPINQYAGDHLHYSLQAMQKQAQGVEDLVPTSEQKDIPQEVVDGTMEAGKKGKEQTTRFVLCLIRYFYHVACMLLSNTSCGCICPLTCFFLNCSSLQK